MASKLIYSANINSSIDLEVGTVLGCQPRTKMKTCLELKVLNWVISTHHKIGLWIVYKRNELALILVNHWFL